MINLQTATYQDLDQAIDGLMDNVTEFPELLPELNVIHDAFEARYGPFSMDEDFHAELMDAVYG